MAIALVGSISTSTDGSDITRTIGAGNLLVLGVKWEDTTNKPTGITVTGNSNAVEISQSAAATTNSGLWYVKNTASYTNATISVTWGSGAVSKAFFVLEFSGCDTTAPLDTGTYNSNTGYGANVATTNANTTSVADEVLVAVVANYVASTVVPNPSPSTWNEPWDYSANSVEAQYLIVSSTGVYNGAGTITASNWSCSFASFKILGGVSAAVTPSFITLTRTWSSE